MAQSMKEESKRPFFRALFVVVLAAIALSLTLPNIYDDVYPVYGSFGMIWGEDHVACCLTPHAEAAGAHAGDRINFSVMPMEDRYWDGIGRAPRIGKTVTFQLTRGNTTHVATLTSQYEGVYWAGVWREVAQDAATLILVSGMRVDLPEKEHALLLTVALARSAVNLDELTDSLWPEADGDAARNAFHACLHRLRNRTGDSRVVRRLGAGYTLHPGSVVDLWNLQDALAACTACKDLEQLEILNSLYSALRFGRERRATLGTWFAEFEQMLLHKERDAERILADSKPYENTTHRA